MSWLFWISVAYFLPMVLVIVGGLGSWYWVQYHLWERMVPRWGRYHSLTHVPQPLSFGTLMLSLLGYSVIPVVNWVSFFMTIYYTWGIWVKQIREEELRRREVQQTLKENFKRVHDSSYGRLHTEVWLSNPNEVMIRNNVVNLEASRLRAAKLGDY